MEIENLKEIIRSIRDYLLLLQDAGIGYIETKDMGKKGPSKSQLLEELRKEIGDCKRCNLWKTRKNLVFGEGDPEAKLVFVGEAPGTEEDIQGRPFVGKAGELLTRIIKAIDLTREQVYIANIIKCHPPGNRTPKPEEIEICYPFLQRQLDIIKPKLICALGSVAVQTLLETQERITKLRGRFYQYRDAKLIATYHPAFLLRNPLRKRETWEDMKLLREQYLKC